MKNIIKKNLLFFYKINKKYNKYLSMSIWVNNVP